MPVGDVQPVSTAWTVAVVAGVFAAVLVFWGRVLYSDTYTALSAGRLIARSGLPSHDSLTVAANGGRWIDEQWLAHLIYYGAWRVGGYALMGAVSALLVAAAFGLLFRLMVRRGASPVFAFGCVGLAFAVSDLNLETRPQSFSYPLFVLLLTLLCAEQRSPRFRRRLLFAWPLLVLWGNLHGSVLLGIAACGAFAFVRGISAARRGDALEVARYLGWLAVGVMSALVTPYGTGILGYYPSLLGNPNLRYIGEWQHASLGGPSIPFLVLLVGTASYAAFAWRRGARPDPFLACLAAALTLMGLQAIRYQVWFALIAALLVSDLSTRVRRRSAPTTRRADFCLASLPRSPAWVPWRRPRSLPQRRPRYSREKRPLLRFEQPRRPLKRHTVRSSPTISRDRRFPGFTRNSPGEWPLTRGRRSFPRSRLNSSSASSP